MRAREFLARGEPRRGRFEENGNRGERAGGRRRAYRHRESRGDPGCEQALGQREHQDEDRAGAGADARGDHRQGGVAQGESTLEQFGVGRMNMTAAWS